MAKLAFCGLGQMGAPMAARLLDAGHDVTVWNRTPERAEPLRERGAAVAATPAEAARGAEGAFTMLADPDALEQVVFGKGGLAESLGPGSTVIEMSTVGPAAIAQLAERLPAGVDLVDAPVRGSVAAATEGSLRILVGASDQAFARWAPVLEALGIPTHTGPVGTGAAMKLVNNLTVLGLTGVAAEALALARGLGLETGPALDLLAQTPLGSWVEYVRGKVQSGEYPPNFKLSLAEKDLRLALDAAAEAGLSLRIADAARSWLADAERAGLDGMDHTAVIGFVGEAARR